VRADRTGNSEADGSVICPSCGNRNIECIGRLRDSISFAGLTLEAPVSGSLLYRGLNCLLGFRHPTLGEAEYFALYDNKQTSQWTSNSIRTDWTLILERINSTRKDCVRVLDIGCNTGELLALAPDYFKKYGVEVNTAAAEVAAARGITVYHRIEAIPAAARFDTIILSDVIEHVADPASLLTYLSGRLSAEGEILITTGDFENPLWRKFGASWRYCSFPEHISFISESWAAKLCESGTLRVDGVVRFSYIELNRVKFTADFILMTLYGIFPRAYQKKGETLKSVFGKSSDVSIRGIGMSRDHIFLTLKSARHE